MGSDPIAPETAASSGRAEQSSIDELLPLVYKELRRLASSFLRSRDPRQSLQPTDLVHEAYLRLVDRSRSGAHDRAHFFNLAASVMRQILVDHARAKAADKRGGGAAHTELRDELNAGLQYTDDKAAGLVALDDALKALASVDERKAKVVELRYFGGLSVEETAEALGISIATVGRETRYAEAWLRRELAGSDPSK